jgi:hypothetical protein
MKNYDNILNKYLDNELTIQEIEELSKLINEDEKFKIKLDVQKFVHNTLYNIPIKFAPNGFTDLVMNKIVDKLSDRYRKYYLFRGVISVFTLLLIVVLFWFFYFIGELEIVQSAVEYSSNYKDKIIPSVNYFTDYLKTDIFKTVSGIVSFIILIGFYFSFNSHKTLTDKLKKM